MDKEIIKIYKERKNRMIELLETMEWEQAVKIVDGEDYQDRIDAICYPNGKKKEYEEEIGEVSYLYSIIGSNQNEGGKYSCKKRDTTIKGKEVYARIFIKRVGYSVYLGDGKYEYIYDNATEEELKDILNGKISIGYTGYR